MTSFVAVPTRKRYNVIFHYGDGTVFPLNTKISRFQSRLELFKALVIKANVCTVRKKLTFDSVGFRTCNRHLVWQKYQCTLPHCRTRQAQNIYDVQE